MSVVKLEKKDNVENKSGLPTNKPDLFSTLSFFSNLTTDMTGILHNLRFLSKL